MIAMGVRDPPETPLATLPPLRGASALYVSLVAVPFLTSLSS